MIGGSGSLVFGKSLVRVEMEQLDTGGVYTLDMFSQKLFDPVHFQWMKR